MEEKKKQWAMTSLLLLTKSAKLVKVAKAVKLLKFTKFLVTFFTMSLSVLIYSFMMGPAFAFGFVIMLFIHEMGHVIAMNQKGYQVKAPVFIPMLGAVIFAPKFKNTEEEAYIGFGGPLLGSLAALLLFGVWWVMPEKSELILMLSYTAAFLNLFNLIPLRPLDGGRITQIAGSGFKYLGVVILIWFSWVIRDPVILLIWIVVLQDIRINPWFRFSTSMAAQAAMTLLMVMGYGEQHWGVDLMDVILASFINLAGYARAKGKISEEDEIHTPAPMNLRVKWAVLYLLLTLGIVLLMLFQVQYLPEHLKK